MFCFDDEWNQLFFPISSLWGRAFFVLFVAEIQSSTIDSFLCAHNIRSVSAPCFHNQINYCYSALLRNSISYNFLVMSQGPHSIIFNPVNGEPRCAHCGAVPPTSGFTGVCPSNIFPVQPQVGKNILAV